MSRKPDPEEDDERMEIILLMSLLGVAFLSLVLWVCSYGVGYVLMDILRRLGLR